MGDKTQTRAGQALTEISNAMVALHREQFGRGPGAAKTTIDGELVVCTLSDVFTQVEKTLIAAGKFDHVRETRTLHQAAHEAEYRQRVEEITGREVKAVMCTVHADPDLAVELFLLG